VCCTPVKVGKQGFVEFCKDQRELWLLTGGKLWGRGLLDLVSKDRLVCTCEGGKRHAKQKE
jgi:hypothetical protein